MSDGLTIVTVLPSWGLWPTYQKANSLTHLHYLHATGPVYSPKCLSLGGDVSDCSVSHAFHDVGCSSLVADPPGFVLWSKGIPPGDLHSKAPFPNHTLSISHRDKDGLVEVHEKFADVIVVQTGNATLIVGGEVVEPASTEPGEMRGKSIRGEIKRTVSPGDVIHIGVGPPHQFLIVPREQITC